MPPHSSAPSVQLPDTPIALVGLMGVGKTTIGRRLSKKLGWAFFDSDDEIEKASGRTIIGYFRDYGEAAFRQGEKRVIERILEQPKIILATGGGAFIPDSTRQLLMDNALTIWLKGDLDTIMDRVTRKDTRPLLQVDDPRKKMQELMDARYPIYAEAHITVDIKPGTHFRTVDAVYNAICAYYEESANA